MSVSEFPTDGWKTKTEKKNGKGIIVRQAKQEAGSLTK